MSVKKFLKDFVNTGLGGRKSNIVDPNPDKNPLPSGTLDELNKFLNKPVEPEPQVTEMQGGSLFTPYERVPEIGDAIGDVAQNVYDTFTKNKVNPEAGLFSNEPIFIRKEDNASLRDRLLNTSGPQVKYSPSDTSLENTQGVGPRAASSTNMERVNTMTGGQGVNISGEVNVSGGNQPQEIRTTNLPPNPAAKEAGMMSAVDKARNKFEEVFGLDLGTSATDGIGYAPKPAENYGEDPMMGEAGTFGSEGYDLPYKVRRSAAERVKINRKERGEAAEEFRKKENYDAFFKNRSKTLGTTAQGLGVNKGQQSLYSPNRGLRRAKRLVAAGFPKVGNMVAANWALSPEADAPIMNKELRDRLTAASQQQEEMRKNNSRLEKLLMEQTRLKLMDQSNKGSDSIEGAGTPTASLNQQSFSPQTGRNPFFPTRMKATSSQLSI